jgi:hypothetical protein
MKIDKFVKSLVPMLEKDEILGEIIKIKAELEKETIPAYSRVALPLLKSWKFKSEQMEIKIGSFNSLINKKSGNIINTIDSLLPEVLRNLIDVEHLAEQVFTPTTAASGLTFMKAQLLQYVEFSGFVARYARRFLIYTFVMETASAQDDAELNVADAMAPADYDWIDQNFVNFVTALNVCAGTDGDVKKKMEAIPDIQITEDNVHTVPETVGMNRVDPLKMGFVSVVLNPFFHFGMRIAEMQVRRYNAAREELKLVQLQKLNLEKISQGKPDASVQKQIMYAEERIKRLNADITRMEQKYA